MALSGLEQYDLLPFREFYTTRQVAEGTQALLICIEMLAASLAHRAVFSYKDYKPGSAADLATSSRRQSFGSAFGDMFDNQQLHRQTRALLSQTLGDRGLLGKGVEVGREVGGALLQGGKTVLDLVDRVDRV